MRRFAMDKLLDWKKKSNRKPLILMGARQVGKTWLMKEFGKTYYEKTAYISFYNNQRMQAVFDTDFDIKRIIMNLNIESGVTITPENTLIVLDEIQNASVGIFEIFLRRSTGISCNSSRFTSWRGAS